MTRGDWISAAWCAQWPALQLQPPEQPQTAVHASLAPLPLSPTANRRQHDTNGLGLRHASGIAGGLERGRRLRCGLSHSQMHRSATRPTALAVIPPMGHFSGWLDVPWKARASRWRVRPARSCTTVAYPCRHLPSAQHDNGTTLRKSHAYLNAAAISCIIAGALDPEPVAAACICRCGNGNVQPICQGATDLPPINSPSICPITPPSISPMQSPTLPPLGTQGCRQAQVLNPMTGQHQWRAVCQ